MMDIEHCPICESEMVFRRGPSNSPVLIIGYAPDEGDMDQYQPFSAANGLVLRTEFGYCGMDTKRMRIVYLYRHPIPKTGGDTCQKYFEDEIYKDIQGKRAILLVGSETVMHFTNQKVMDYNGLLVPSNLPAPIVMAAVSPGKAYHGGVGEVRFAIRNFSQKIDGLL